MHVEVSLGGLPIVGSFREESGDEAQEGGIVWKDGGDAGAAFDFLVDPLERIGGAQAALVGGGEGEDGEALRKGGFQPGGEFGGGGGVGGDDFLETALGAGAVRAGEDAADVGGDLGAQVQARDVGLGVLLEVELAALPGQGGKDGAAGGAQAGVVVGDEELEAAEAALLEAREEVAPVDFGFAQGDADAEDLALAVGTDAQGDEHRAVEHAAAVADLFIAGIEEDVGEGTEGAGAPELEIGVEAGGALADLSGTHGGAAKLFEDGGDFASGDALDIHFGEGEDERLLAADALLEGRRIEVDLAAHLRDGEGDGAQAGLEGLGFEAVGVAQAGIGALERPGSEHVGTLGVHGLVDEQAKPLGKAVGAFVIEELQHGLEELRMMEVGHVWFWFWCFADTPT